MWSALCWIEKGMFIFKWYVIAGTDLQVMILHFYLVVESISLPRWYKHSLNSKSWAFFFLIKIHLTNRFCSTEVVKILKYRVMYRKYAT